ncbi:MAG: Crp/Fnr family transcriptional regulator [Isosphaeraceae bacterium]
MLQSATDHEETFRDGDVIVREGEDGREMYVIQRGSVSVSKTIAGREVEMARLERGEFFGEMSLLESLPRNATIRAVGETTLLVVKPGSLLLKIRRNPTFACEMLLQMSKRLRKVNERLVALMGSDEVAAQFSERLAEARLATEFGEDSDGAR